MEGINDTWYKENVNIEFWEDLLSRKLNKNELKLFYGVWKERDSNILLHQLETFLPDGLKISNLTKQNGNCLFESLGKYLKLGLNDMNINPTDALRMSVSSILLISRDTNYFFPNIEQTPNEIFSNINEIDIVFDKNSMEYYIYDK